MQYRSDTVSCLEVVTSSLQHTPQHGPFLLVKRGGFRKIRYTWNLFRSDPPPPRASRTWEVAAASGRAASHPAALIHRHRPGLQFVGLQGISREVADLQLCEMVDEIVIGHPERLEERESYGRLGKVRLRDERSAIRQFRRTWAQPQRGPRLSL